MSAVKIRYTYDRVTEESAADGEASESGWYSPGGWHFAADDKEAAEYIDCSAREAVEGVIEHVGYIDHAQVREGKASLYGSESQAQFHEPYEETRCAHIECHPRLLSAIVKALRARRVLR